MTIINNDSQPEINSCHFFLLFFFSYSIMNSLVIVLFLSGMVAMIMLRTLHKDIARYNQMDSVVRASLSEMELLVLFKSTKRILLLLAGCRVWWGKN